MLGPSVTSAEEVAEFDRGHLAARGKIGLVQNERAPVVVSAEKPSVAFFAVVDLSPALRHMSACAWGNNRARSGIVPLADQFAPAECSRELGSKKDTQSKIR